MSHFACHMSHYTCHMSNAWNLDSWDMLNNKKWVFVIITCYISHVTLRMSHVICQMLMLILGTCWTTFVFMCKLKSEYLLLCHMSHVACHMSHVACHMSHVKCLCWSSWHAEQVLFSCPCSKLSVYSQKLQWFFLDHLLLILWV